MQIPNYGTLQLDDQFFSEYDHAVFRADKASSSRFDGDRQQIRDKFLALHDVLYPEIKRRGWDLHPHWHSPNIVSSWYIGRTQRIQFMKLRYLRSKDQVRKVEQMMGIPRPLDRSETQYTKHPMLDIHLSSRYLAIELLLTHQGWWDAQNFKRKVEQHEQERRTFVELMEGLGHDYILGGWPDTNEPQLIRTTKAQTEDALLEWLSKFEPGHNWLRLGVWYDDPEDLRLTRERIADEIITRFAQLYPIYEFILWRSDNDYR